MKRSKKKNFRRALRRAMRNSDAPRDGMSAGRRCWGAGKGSRAGVGIRDYFSDPEG